MEDGLANDMVNAVAIDGQWVWFATDEGVSRYDMETDTFATFRTIDGLASDQVSSIAIDGKLRLVRNIRRVKTVMTRRLIAGRYVPEKTAWLAK